MDIWTTLVFAALGALFGWHLHGFLWLSRRRDRANHNIQGAGATHLSGPTDRVDTGRCPFCGHPVAWHEADSNGVRVCPVRPELYGPGNQRLTDCCEHCGRPMKLHAAEPTGEGWRVRCPETNQARAVSYEQLQKCGRIRLPRFKHPESELAGTVTPAFDSVMGKVPSCRDCGHSAYFHMATTTPAAAREGEPVTVGALVFPCQSPYCMCDDFTEPTAADYKTQPPPGGAR